MKNLFSSLLALAGLLFGSMLSAAELHVEAPWIREAPPNAMALGGFMVLHNRSAEEVKLVAATSPAFDSVQLHRTVAENGMARMVHQESIAVPAHGETVFKPGDYHLMLMQPKQPLKAGERVEVTLMFDNGSRQTVTFPVQAGAMAMPMDHGSMHHH